MITRKQYRNAKDTVHYFDVSLAQADYHTQDGQIIGTWNGVGAALLNLGTQVHRDEFERLCHNRHPGTAERLTKRTLKGRTVAEDWTFSVPKSVSIQHAITKDGDIIKAMEWAIIDTMLEVERDAEARVRKEGVYDNRKTGNLVYAAYTHDDTRPVEREVDGKKAFLPDPQLHQHVVIINATYDEAEGQWKAVQFRNMVASIPYYREVFNSRLANRLQDCGYQLERTAQNFELAGYDRKTIEKFSQRTALIEEVAREKGITDPAAKAELGAKTRTNKRKGMGEEELRQFRLSQLDERELKVIRNAKSVADAGERKNEVEAARNAVDHAIGHGLARKSVVEHRELVRHALKHGKVSTTKEAVELAIERHEELRSKETANGRIYTNVEAHVEEKKLIAEARNGVGKHAPINPGYEVRNRELSEEQKKAVEHALNSRDFITMIAGRAGTGKTWSVREIAQGASEAGIPFGAFAPSSEASRRVQREDGFEDATTLAELLVSEKRQESIKGGVIWIDEAGMVGNASMNKAINIAKAQNARILLTGDTRQHNSVERGDAMRIIEKYSDAKPATIAKNQRQKNQQYREAVEALSNGDVESGYGILDRMGAIKESGDLGAVAENVANEYVESTALGEKAIVVATTHLQGDLVTNRVREKMREKDMLGKEDRTFTALRNLNLDDAQKRDWVSYQPGQVVEFHQNAKGGFNRGSRYEVSEVGKDRNILVHMAGDDKKLALPMEEVGKYSVFEKTPLPLAAGDQIRITKSGTSPDDHRLENGDLMTVKSFDERGNIRAHTGRKTVTLDRDFGHLTHGYYVSSPKSQGKTINKVIIMQASVSGRASSTEQFYVSASRGRFSISVHTDDKEQLLHNIKLSSKRMTAMEVVGEPDPGIDLTEGFNNAARKPPQKASELNKDWQQAKAPPDSGEVDEVPSLPPPPEPQYDSLIP
jgi:conjugative relaxase-like TrwC/TraI family protein